MSTPWPRSQDRVMSASGPSLSLYQPRLVPGVPWGALLFSLQACGLSVGPLWTGSNMEMLADGRKETNHPLVHRSLCVSSWVGLTMKSRTETAKALPLSVFYKTSSVTKILSAIVVFFFQDHDKMYSFEPGLVFPLYPKETQL